MENVAWFFLGIAASTIGYFVFDYLKNRVEFQKKIRRLKKETSINLRRIRSFQQISTRFRNALNAKNLQSFFEYFPFEDFLYPIANDMFIRGELYETLNEEQLYQIKAMASSYSNLTQGNIINAINNIKSNNDYKSGYQIVDLFDDKFEKDIKTLEAILSRL